MIRKFKGEEERAIRRKCFENDMFALVHGSLRKLYHKETELSPMEIWVAATTFGNQLLELHAPEEELEYEVNDLKAECQEDMDAFLIMLTASYYLIALRKKRPEVKPLLALLLKQISDHEYYRPLLEEIGDKEDAQWMIGKKIDLLKYEIQHILEDSKDEQQKQLRDLFNVWLEGAAVKSGDAMAQDVLSICYVNMMCGFAFNDIQKQAFEKLGYKTDNKNTDYILGNKISLHPGAQLKDIRLENGMTLEDVRKLLTQK